MPKLLTEPDYYYYWEMIYRNENRPSPLTRWSSEFIQEELLIQPYLYFGRCCSLRSRKTSMETTLWTSSLRGQPFASWAPWGPPISLLQLPEASLSPSRRPPASPSNTCPLWLPPCLQTGSLPCPWVPVAPRYGRQSAPSSESPDRGRLSCWGSNGSSFWPSAA